jgi:hypothetical protein
MSKKVQAILKRALKSGFDLSSIRNYDPKLFMRKLYTYLVSQKYFCFDEGDAIVVSDYLFEDLAELHVDGYHLKITPLKPEGMYDLLIEVFKFVADNPNLQVEDDDTTEEEKIARNLIGYENFLFK